MNAPSTIAICDAGPLIHLDELSALDLLSQYQQVLIPPTVWEETLRHRPHIQFPVPQPTPIVLQPVVLELAQVFNLHDGEREALSLALTYPGSIVLTDDLAARNAGTALRLEVHGTLGVLLQAIVSGQRTREAGLNLLRSIPSISTLHVRRDLLQTAIKAVESL